MFLFWFEISNLSRIFFVLLFFLIFMFALALLHSFDILRPDDYTIVVLLFILICVYFFIKFDFGESF